MAFAQFGCIKSMKEVKTSDLAEIRPESWTSLENNSSTLLRGKEKYWVKSFKNKWLDEAIYTAWSSNSDLISKAEMTLAEGEQATIAGASLLPQASIGLSGSRSRRNLIGFNFPNGSTSFTSESFTSGFNLSWELDLWGKLRDQRNSAKKRFELAQVEYEGARLSLAGQVARMWFAITESDQQINLARKMTDTFEKNKEFVANRFANGLATSLEHDLATNALAGAKATELKRLRIKNQLTREYESLLGQYPQGNDDRNFSDKLPGLSLPHFPPTPAQAMLSRPDLQAALLQLEASGLDLSAAKMSLLPSISFSGGPGSRAEEFGDLLDQKFRTWEVSGSFTQPIFNAGRLRANIRRNKALLNAAEARYRFIALRAFTEIETLLTNELFLQEEETHLMNAANSARKAAQTSWDRYQRGLLDIFDTLDSQRRAFEAESRLLDLSKERVFNRIQLFLALGTPALPYEP